MLYMLELMFDVTCSDDFFRAGRFENDQPGSSQSFPRSKVWLQSGGTNPAPCPPPAGFAPENYTWTVLSDTKANAPTLNDGDFVAVYYRVFIPSGQSLAAGSSFLLTPAVLFGRNGASSPTSSPFTVSAPNTKTTIVNPVLVPSTVKFTYYPAYQPNLPPSVNGPGYCYALGEVNGALFEGQQGPFNFEFLAALTMADSSGLTVSQYSHDPELDVQM